MSSSFGISPISPISSSGQLYHCVSLVHWLPILSLCVPGRLGAITICFLGGCTLYFMGILPFVPWYFTLFFLFYICFFGNYCVCFTFSVPGIWPLLSFSPSTSSWEYNIGIFKKVSVADSVMSASFIYEVQDNTESAAVTVQTFYLQPPLATTTRISTNISYHHYGKQELL